MVLLLLISLDDLIPHSAKTCCDLLLMNNIRSRAEEIVTKELICTD
ncbi:MAG: TnpV protein [Oscillospiraceae bacterium]|nr:TnpV protein [Oscillospiraceae bacterium]